MSPRRTRYVLAKGYVVLWAPGHPLASDTGLVPEHRMVLYDVLGPRPAPLPLVRRPARLGRSARRPPQL
jgi:hypothetical protein